MLPRLYDAEVAASLDLISSGRATPNEAAKLFGISVQLVRYWCGQCGVDWKRARMSYLEGERQKVLNRGKARLVEGRRPK